MRVVSLSNYTRADQRLFLDKRLRIVELFVQPLAVVQPSEQLNPESEGGGGSCFIYDPQDPRCNDEQPPGGGGGGGGTNCHTEFMRIEIDYGDGVDPLSWSPHHWGGRNLRWHDAGTHQSSGSS